MNSVNSLPGFEIRALDQAGLDAFEPAPLSEEDWIDVRDSWRVPGHAESMRFAVMWNFRGKDIVATGVNELGLMWALISMHLKRNHTLYRFGRKWMRHLRRELGHPVFSRCWTEESQRFDRVLGFKPLFNEVWVFGLRDDWEETL